MATIRERLIYAIELVTDRAQAGVKGFKQAVGDAEGSVNKFKAGASSAMASIAANAGTLAIAGGGALLAFGAKAIKSSQDTALAAGKLADATGLTVEAASRLREVSADLGISGETVTAVVKKMQVEIGKGNPVLEELGVALQHTEDGAADVNATLLDTIKRIGAIEDPTKRAQAAQAAFGRGYAEAAELIFTNADKLKEKLDEVSEAKVVTPEELARAREFRDSMEDLKDVGEDLSVSTGQVLIPVLGDLAKLLVEIRDGAADAKDAIEDIPGGESLLDALGTNLFELPKKSKEEWDELGRSLGIIPEKAREIGALREEFNEIVAAGDSANNVIDNQGNLVEDLGARWSAASIPLEAASGNFAELQSEADRAAAAVEGSGDAARDAADDYNVFDEGLRKSAESDAAMARQAEQTTAILESQREVTTALADAEERRISLVNQSLGGAIRLSQAQRDARDSLWRYSETVKEHNEAAPEFKLNQDQMADLVEETAADQLAAAQAAAAYRIEQAEAAGATVSASDEQRILREELDKVVSTLTGPVRDAVLGAITDLDNLAKDRFFTVNGNIVMNQSGREGDFAAAEVGGVAPIVGGVPGRVINVNITTNGELAPEKVVDAIRRYDRLNSPR